MSTLKNTDFRELLSHGGASKGNSQDQSKGTNQDGISAKEKSRLRYLKILKRRQQKEKSKQAQAHEKADTVSLRDRAAERRAQEKQSLGDQDMSQFTSVTEEESKFLGGDIEHTHLVKGLDYALLNRVRSDLEKKEQQVKQQEKLSQKKVGQEKPTSQLTTLLGRRIAQMFTIKLHPHSSEFKQHLQRSEYFYLKSAFKVKQLHSNHQKYAQGSLRYMYEYPTLSANESVIVDSRQNIPLFIYRSDSKSDQSFLNSNDYVAPIHYQILYYLGDISKNLDTKMKQRSHKSTMHSYQVTPHVILDSYEKFVSQQVHPFQKNTSGAPVWKPPAASDVALQDGALVAHKPDPVEIDNEDIFVNAGDFDPKKELASHGLDFSDSEELPQNMNELTFSSVAHEGDQNFLPEIPTTNDDKPLPMSLTTSNAVKTKKANLRGLNYFEKSGSEDEDSSAPFTNNASENLSSQHDSSKANLFQKPKIATRRRRLRMQDDYVECYPTGCTELSDQEDLDSNQKQNKESKSQKKSSNKTSRQEADKQWKQIESIMESKDSKRSLDALVSDITKKYKQTPLTMPAFS